jgi:chromosome segregation ATPase
MEDNKEKVIETSLVPATDINHYKKFQDDLRTSLEKEMNSAQAARERLDTINLGIDELVNRAAERLEDSTGIIDAVKRAKDGNYTNAKIIASKTGKGVRSRFPRLSKLFGLSDKVKPKHLGSLLTETYSRLKDDYSAIEVQIEAYTTEKEAISGKMTGLVEKLSEVSSKLVSLESDISSTSSQLVEQEGALENYPPEKQDSTEYNQLYAAVLDLKSRKDQFEETKIGLLREQKKTRDLGKMYETLRDGLINPLLALARDTLADLDTAFPVLEPATKELSGAEDFVKRVENTMKTADTAKDLLNASLASISLKTAVIEQYRVAVFGDESTGGMVLDSVGRGVLQIAQYTAEQKKIRTDRALAEHATKYLPPAENPAEKE